MFVYVISLVLCACAPKKGEPTSISAPQEEVPLKKETAAEVVEDSSVLSTDSFSVPAQQLLNTVIGQLHDDISQAFSLLRKIIGCSLAKVNFA